MSAWRKAFVEECRSYVGTPYRHQGRSKGVGVDCAGVLDGAARAVGLMPPGAAEDADVLRAYDRAPNGSLDRMLEKYMDRIPLEDRQPGDVALVAWGSTPQHVAIFTTPRHVVHAVSQINQRKARGAARTTEGRVVEVSFGRGLQRVTRAVYRFRVPD